LLSMIPKLGTDQADVEAGNLDDFANEVIKEHRAGKTSEL